MDYQKEKYIDYYDNGKIYYKCYFKNDKKVGEYIGYYVSGKILFKVLF